MPARMRTAVFPERTCRARVQGEYQDCSCEVAEGHKGPCASYSLPESVERRQDWEQAHPEAVETVAPQVWADAKEGAA